jgi:hypothetical protein
MKPNGQHVAEIGYSKELREIQLVLPRGTKVADLTKILDFLNRDVFSKLERGCTNCTSGDHLVIREQLEDVIRVDLDQRALVGVR